MVDFEIPKGSTFVRSIKRVQVSEESFAMGLTTVKLLKALVFVPRLGQITPLEWDLSYGVSDNPSSEMPQWYLALVDVDNLPTIAGLRDRAIWMAVQSWRQLSQIGTIQTMSREIQDFFNPASFTYKEMAGYTQRLALSLVTYASGGGATVATFGVLTYEEMLIQRKWGNDNATYGESDSAAGDGLIAEDVDLDYEG